ncbi:EamA family transporter [Neisseria sp. Ec49-e6-T10]|uniref:EamA family transporter n=1 Tax=Neisseria sp. Ec49-e6-T10 TaxID=3140744 RepID=UPI003EB9355D
MSPKDLLLISVVIISWGLNFVVIKVGLNDVPPLLLGALRFCVLAIPAFFIKRPKVAFGWLLLYGLTISFGQFAFLFSAISFGMPAGLASMVLQSQAFFTLFLAVLFLGEKFYAQNILGLLISAAGLGIIGLQGGASVPLLGLSLTLAAAFAWAIGNIVMKKLSNIDMVSLTVWGGLVPIIPFFVASYIFEGPKTITHSLTHLNLTTVFVLFYLAFIATLLGYSIWGKLMAKYKASQVAPFSLLVPIIGITSSAYFLNEKLTIVEIAGALLVMLGLVVNIFGRRIMNKFEFMFR